MKTLDRYVVRNFLITALLCFAVMMSLRIVADLFVNMDEFTKNRESEPQKGRPAAVRAKDKDEEKGFGKIVTGMATYYGYQSLVYFRDLGGIIIVTAAAFTLARMSHTNELTAMLASGVSLHRVLVSILFSAVALNLLVIVDTELLIPPNKHQLVRSRDDVEGTETFRVRLLTDSHDSVWYSHRFRPADKRLWDPLIVLRDERLAYAGHISGSSASYDARRRGWVFSPQQPPQPRKSPVHARMHLAGARTATTTEFVPTNVGPAEVVQRVRKLKKYRRSRINWDAVRAISNFPVHDAARGLTIRFERLAFSPPGDYATAVLENPRFEHRIRGRPAVCLAAPSATFGYSKKAGAYGWTLRDGGLIYTCDLDPASLALRQSRDWVQYMSTAELNSLLALERVPDVEGARLVRHSRFADFFNNIILLLVAVPFILSRERNIKSSAGLTVLVVGLVYVFIYFTRHYEGLNPVLAAWLPILVFGPVSAVMLDAVKT